MGPATPDIELELKRSFRELFPDYARELDKATSNEEIEALRVKFVRAEAEKLRGTLDDALVDQISGGGGVEYALTPTQYSNLKSATGDTIKVELQTLINSLKVIKSIKSPTAEDVASQMIAAGVGAMASGIGAFFTSLSSGAAGAVATLAGVEAVSVAGIVGIVAVVIVAALIPIIYFMQKPAACFVLVINEITTSGQLSLGTPYNVHGKNVQSTPNITNAMDFGDGHIHVTCGFMVTSKHDNALVGTQNGYVYSYKHDTTTTDFAIGVECPLTGIYVDNNCWCEIGASAETAAKQTDSNNQQSWTSSNSDYEMSIVCNSGSGSIAYYIARIGPKSGS